MTDEGLTKRIEHLKSQVPVSSTRAARIEEEMVKDIILLFSEHPERLAPIFEAFESNGKLKEGVDVAYRAFNEYYARNGIDGTTGRVKLLPRSFAEELQKRDWKEPELNYYFKNVVPLFLHNA